MSQTEIITLGCRLNIHESEIMKELASTSDLKNIVIINTCAVTEEAERQARQTIRSLRRERPDAFLIATGCAVQMRPEIFANMQELDRIIGNDIKLEAESFSKDFDYRTKVGNIARLTTLEIPLVAKFKGRSRAFLQIQNGCNHRCAFCTIPLARGRSRSVPFGVIVDHVRTMLSNGIQEIVLTGVDLTSYGQGLPGELTLGTMIKRLLTNVPELQRLRLSSLDSIEIDDTLLRLFLEDQRLLPHMHLSLQAGHNTVLKAMKRRHTTEQAAALCQQIHKERPEFVFGADFIVGFPGETEDMFQKTLDTVEACSLTHLHVFPFSKRPGTVAADLPDQVPQAIIKERGHRLRSLGKTRLTTLFTRHVGKTLPVLMEQPRKGHTDDFSPVLFAQDMPKNTIINATILGHTEGTLLA